MIEKSLTTIYEAPNRSAPVGVSEADIKPSREPIPDAEPLDDPLDIAPHIRSRYFRENIYPYAARMRSREYYEHKLPLQIELIKLQNWMRDSGERGDYPIRGARRRGQGRRDNALYGALEPSHRPCGRAGQAIGCGVGAVVLPAIHPKLSDRRRDCPL